MSWARVVIARLRGLVASQRFERELEEEVRFHLEMQIEENQKSGMNLAEARYAALRSFGGVDRMKELHRELRTFRRIETLVQDFRYAVRVLKKDPGFAMTVVGVLALAIGANTAVFSVLNTVLLRPLPYRLPDQLAMLWTEDPVRNFREGRSALWDVEQWRSQSRSFADLATFDAVNRTLTESNGVQPVAGASISPNLLSVLGVQPVLGRGFSAEEAEQGERVVLISHRFWQAQFAGSPQALGATLVLDGLPSRIIGVLPRDFRVAALSADVWEPHPNHQAVRGPETWFVLGRLRPGVTIDRAQTEMRAIAHRLKEQLPADEANRTIRVVQFRLFMIGRQSRFALWLLSATVFCLFLIAAANATSLCLARTVARSHEIAVRVALGASRGRIVQQLLSEGLLLASASGLIGALLAFMMIPLIRTYGPGNFPRLQEIALDFRVLAAALAVSAFAGVLLGLSPAIAALRRDLRFSNGGRSVSPSVAARRIRCGLVVADFALAILLLTGAGLLLRSWWYVNRVDPGFRPEQVLGMELAAPPGLGPEQRIDLLDRLLQAIRATPGVLDAGLIGDLLIANARDRVVTTQRDEGAFSERLQFAADEISANFFQTLKTPLLNGRFFSVRDQPGTLRVAIINDAMARRLWPGQNPVGKRFKFGPPDSNSPWYTVAGVVADMRRQGLEREPIPQMFVPLAQSSPSQTVNVFVRTSVKDPMLMAETLRNAVRRVEKRVPVYWVAPLEQQFGSYLAQRRLVTWLLTGFSFVALLMAAAGIYGLIQYSVAARAREIGIRIAVGAENGPIFRMILGEGLKLSVAGLALGLVGALCLGRLGSSLLFGVTPTDPWTLLGGAFLLMVVAVAACCLPARRATRVEPVIALRQE
jgi:predicted permease